MTCESYREMYVPGKLGLFYDNGRNKVSGPTIPNSHFGERGSSVSFLCPCGPEVDDVQQTDPWGYVDRPLSLSSVHDPNLLCGPPSPGTPRSTPTFVYNLRSFQLKVPVMYVVLYEKSFSGFCDLKLLYKKTERKHILALIFRSPVVCHLSPIPRGDLSSSSPSSVLPLLVYSSTFNDD